MSEYVPGQEDIGKNHVNGVNVVSLVADC